MIFGEDGDDVITGAGGNDRLVGGNGDDVYVFGRGYGHDVVMDAAGELDRVTLVSDLSAGDITLHREETTWLLASRARMTRWCLLIGSARLIPSNPSSFAMAAA